MDSATRQDNGSDDEPIEPLGVDQRWTQVYAGMIDA